jgi:hypothetical protein
MSQDKYRQINGGKLSPGSLPAEPRETFFEDFLI